VTATILLIRHAAHSHLGHILSGRSPDIALSGEGRLQAARLATRLGRETLSAVYSSPVQRACETAQAIATRHPGLTVETVPALDELNFGEWTGRSFAELADDPRWTIWNEVRSCATAPAGESMRAAQRRAWAHVSHAARLYAGRTIAMVSHCDIIRAIVAQVLGLSLDHYGRFDIDPASITHIAVGDWGGRILRMNETINE
jgi:probable phosphoglycerate mutase